MMSDQSRASQTIETWPALPLPDWLDTLDTLHMWTQIVGKVKLELTPFVNEWWNVGFFVTPRGLTTGSIPTGERLFSIDFDFVGHSLYIYASDSSVSTMQLTSRSVADFFAEFMDTLRAMGIEVTINTRPLEFQNRIRYRSTSIMNTRPTIPTRSIDGGEYWFRATVSCGSSGHRSMARAVRFSSIGARLTSATRASRVGRRLHRLVRGTFKSRRIRKITPAASGREMSVPPALPSANRPFTPITFQCRTVPRSRKCIMPERYTI